MTTRRDIRVDLLRSLQAATGARFISDGMRLGELTDSLSALDALLQIEEEYEIPNALGLAIEAEIFRPRNGSWANRPVQDVIEIILRNWWPEVA